MNKVLVISPHFPPSNAADMHRIRMSLPYFRNLGWETELVCVEDDQNDIPKDPLLLESIPQEIVIHYVKAFNKKWTSKFGLGSLALRSLWFYRKKVNQLLERGKYDLIYFSTTQFPLCILGAYWKKKFKIPYVIDMQDPWHSDYYQNKPKKERPRKYWFSYRLHKYLEPIAMKQVDGLVSVSSAYIKILHERYPRLRDKPSKVITFGAFDHDFEIASEHKNELKPAFEKKKGYMHLVYVGRGGYDMQNSVRIILMAFKTGLLKEPSLFEKLRFHFIGTSYAPAGQGQKTLLPIAVELGLEDYVEEQTSRIGFYQNIRTLQVADALIILSSEDPKYTASKIYPYILSKKALLGIFHPESSAIEIIRSCNAGKIILSTDTDPEVYKQLREFILGINDETLIQTDRQAFEPYTARVMAQKQADLFNDVVSWKP